MFIAFFIAALSMGFFGSPHCLGMCGGIVTAFGISMQNYSPTKRRMLIAMYHVGRLLSYMLLGLIATIFGKELLAPLLSDNLAPRFILGGALVFAALLMLGVPFLGRVEKLGMGMWQAMSPIRAKVLPLDNPVKAIFAGILWGFLPCGLVYGALGVAVGLSTAGSSMNGVLFMLGFGLGTMPALLMASTTIRWLQQHVKRFNLRQFSGAVLLVSGLAVAFAMPIMHTLHGGHHHGHGEHHSHDDVSEHGHHSHEHNHHTNQGHHEHMGTNHSHH
ncbi:sulfite exporter TauE/SafE family protein [Moraxella nasovis]|uniref:sulfite exporter TauE/SafE family protein n=1 Tax=Moraxella nasovis TaxID=2904121 RepID=UPI001F611DEA|nr:sulfite exporter TauE/SafE family protein [Moraxella nasovis]UNU72853.1 sulfite exporter TauE/SafE family protein [Moraxella nasovis]